MRVSRDRTLFVKLNKLTADRLAQLVVHLNAVWEVAGSNLGPDQHSGSLNTEENVLPL